MPSPTLVIAGFSESFQAAPTVLSASPGRINLIGEHTDYNEGFVLPASIDRECVCAFRQNSLNTYRLYAIDLGEIVEVNAKALAPHPKQWANYLLGVIDEFRERGIEVPGFDVAFSCDVPQGAGLSSSAAIECAFAKGLAELLGVKLDDWDIVRIGQAAENGFVGANTGMLDQFASVFGEADTALLLDCRSLEVSKQAINLPGHSLLVLNTKVEHNHVTSGYADRRRDCEEAVAAMQAGGWQGTSLRDASLTDVSSFHETLSLHQRKRARFVIEENARVLRAIGQLDRGDVAGFGESLLAGHWGLSNDYEVSCPESDALVRFAEQHPAAKGARQMGGGFGGCVLTVVEQGQEANYIAAAQQHYTATFGFPFDPLEVRIGPGARILPMPEQQSHSPKGGPSSHSEAEPSGPTSHSEPKASGPSSHSPKGDPTSHSEPKASGPTSHSEAVPASEGRSVEDAPHRRLNILTGEWVLVSPHRAKRPWQGQTEDTPPATRPSYDPGCYLCPGNTRVGGEVNPDYGDTYWFTNDFAALNPDGGDWSHQDGLLVAESEPGTCRVLCFSPDHSKTLADMSVAEIEKVVTLWQEQYAELGALDYVNHVQIFENKGAMMGCSNPHPHGQIWSQRTPPAVVQAKGQHMLDYYQNSDGNSLLSAYVEQEIAAETRVIYHDEHFVALVPWWAVWPFEVMIAPRRPMPHIGELEEAEATAFAKTISEVTSRYDRLFQTSFPYSAGIHQALTDGVDYAHWHWHMEFKPPLLRSATVKKFMVGYELFAMPQRDITAEGAAERLRKC